MLTVGLLLCFNVAKSQDIEAGLFLGTAQYQGDLSSNQITLSETKPGFGGIFRYYFHPRLNFKGNIYFGWIEGDDANYADDDAYRKKRNLSFRSPVLDVSAQLEFNILPYINGSHKYKFSPYLFGGVSGFYFNPQAELDGKWYSLQPLGTEGQLISGGDGAYSRFQVALPFGVGLKYSVGKGWNIGLEVGQRKTFTDYLDDVSDKYADLDQIRNAAGSDGDIAVKLADRSGEVPKYGKPSFQVGSGRGNPDNKDWYLFGGFFITKTFRSNQCTGF